MNQKPHKQLLVFSLIVMALASWGGAHPAMAAAAQPPATGMPAAYDTQQANLTKPPAAPLPGSNLTSTPLPLAKPAAQMLVPKPPKVSARNYILLDAHTSTILATKQAEARVAPASLTKMMTMYLVSSALQQGRIHLQDAVHISEKAWHASGSRMFVKVGSSVPVEQLVQGIVVESGNDATVAMAEFVAGSESAFVDLMNQTAAQLGLHNTHYMNATGMPMPGHYTTAADTAKLAQALVTHFPEYYHWYGQKWFRYNKIKQPNRNRLLWRDPRVDGIKTGHTEDAGFCLVASAQERDMRLIAVIMGTPTDTARSEDSEALLTYGFHFYETHKLYAAHTPMTLARVWQSQQKQVALGLDAPLYITLPAGQYTHLQAQMSLPKKITAPVKAGQPIGSLVVTLHNKPLLTRPMVALSDAPLGGFFTRVVDRIRGLFYYARKESLIHDPA